MVNTFLVSLSSRLVNLAVRACHERTDKMLFQSMADLELDQVKRLSTSLLYHITRGNSLETPNVWGLSSFHPNVSKQPPPPQCLGFCPLFTPTFLSRRAGSDVDATAAADPPLSSLPATISFVLPCADMVATWLPRPVSCCRGVHVAASSAR